MPLKFRIARGHRHKVTAFATLPFQRKFLYLLHLNSGCLFCMIDIPLKSRYFPQVMNPEKQLYTRARQALKLTFKKKFLLESALSHPSFRNENPRIPGLADFDRLEFFGDTILNFVICRRLYEKFPLADEGELSKLRSILVSRKMLFLLAKK